MITAFQKNAKSQGPEAHDQLPVRDLMVHEVTLVPVAQIRVLLLHYDEPGN